MSRHDQDEEQQRREEIGVEAWRRLVQNARALGTYGRIEVIGHVEDGKLVTVREAVERTHK